MEINENVLVTGSNGQLAKSIKFFSTKYPFNFFFETKSKLDITNHSLVNDFLRKNKIKVIINCAAYTDVSNAKKDYLIAESVNHLAVSNLANYCKKFNIKLIHISTDYVFDGNKNKLYVEEDITNPLNHYGITKLNAEKKILGCKLKNSVIVRTSWLYSLNTKNFLGKILKNFKTLNSFNVVDDQISSPTNPDDLAKIILEMILKIKNSSTQIYHYSNLGSCSRFEMAQKIKEIINSSSIINPVPSNNQEIIRPKFTVLNSKKIVNKFGFKILNWSESLEKYMRKYYFIKNEI